MKIGFASNDWSRSMVTPNQTPVMGGSGHIRVGQYILPLRKKGVEVAVGILAHNSMTGTFGVHSFDASGDHFDCDVIVMQRYMHKNVLPDMKRAQAAGQIIINDVDDWYWGLSEKNAAYAMSDPTLSPDENIQWYKNILEESDAILASTPYLQKKMSDWNDNVHLHTNYVTTAQYKNVPPFESTTLHKLVVGWMGSTAHRSGDLEILKPYSDQITKFATFHHTGDIKIPNVPRFFKEIGVNAGSVSTSPFLPPYQLQDGFRFQVGIVPLTNIPFNHAKSYIKGLEYAAAGIPFVCSYSPQYEELIAEHGIGLMVNDPSEYPAALERFRDKDYLKETSSAVRRNVKKFDINVGAELLYKTILKIHKEHWRAKG
tara:strand:+ start:3139 stop:4254 length:1116 start_codon:yes stop_codon:yes gene_type:complete